VRGSFLCVCVGGFVRAYVCVRVRVRVLLCVRVRVRVHGCVRVSVKVNIWWLFCVYGGWGVGVFVWGSSWLVGVYACEWGNLVDIL